MYVVIASVKGPETMPNEEIMSGVNAQFLENDPWFEELDEVEHSKKSGFLLYEDGCWNVYVEEMR